MLGSLCKPCYRCGMIQPEATELRLRTCWNFHGLWSAPVPEATHQPIDRSSLAQWVHGAMSSLLIIPPLVRSFAGRRWRIELMNWGQGCYERQGIVGFRHSLLNSGIHMAFRGFLLLRSIHWAVHEPVNLPLTIAGWALSSVSSLPSTSQLTSAAVKSILNHQQVWING